MSFTSINFLIFLPVVFFLYWLVFQKDIKLQNLFILMASYVFYGWWSWKYLFLLLTCSGINYLAGIALGATDRRNRRRIILAAACILSLGLLGALKYFNFFAGNLVHAFSLLGIHVQSRTLQIILPVGISFYVFKALSYTIDVYRGKLERTKDVIAFLSFVSFFPQLLAGPIERATSLLPQFFQRRVFEYDEAVDALRQILWGLFVKIVIADNCAPYVDQIFQSYTTQPASTLVLGAVFFTFQIYGDFSGYSNIAVGVSRLFGFNAVRNFSFPYFSRDIAEFWRRWHISLTTWFRDYLYIPLGGNRGTKYQVIRNTFIVFLVSGFWHGANWTFIVWGLVHALLFMPLLLMGKNRRNMDTVAYGRILPNLREFLHMGTTFGLVCFAWIFFRADTIDQALSYIRHMFQKSLLTVPKNCGETLIVPLIFLLVSVEWLQRDKEHALEGLRMHRALRWTIYSGIIASIFIFSGREQKFIYFQF